jgi:hypothetical protein
MQQQRQLNTAEPHVEDMKYQLQIPLNSTGTLKPAAFKKEKNLRLVFHMKDNGNENLRVADDL